jgi:hypothetical protein
VFATPGGDWTADRYGETGKLVHHLGESVTEWADAVQHLEGSQVLWLDLLDISDAEEAEVKDALRLEDLEICGAGHEIAVLTQREDYLEVTAVCVAEAEDGSAPQAPRSIALSARTGS